MATEKPRFSVTFSDGSFRKIKKYQEENNISTQSKAVAQLVELAIREIESECSAAEAVPSSEALEISLRERRSMDTFGQRLLASREKHNLSQKELAERLGITPTRLNYWEKDKREPAIEMIKLIAQVLDIDANYLIGYQPKNKQAPDTFKAESKTQPISLEESNQLLMALGFIQEGEDLSDEDLEFLTFIVGLLNNRFSRRQAKPPKAKGYQYRPETYEELEAEVEAYRQRLLLEKKQAEESSPSNGAGDETA